MSVSINHLSLYVFVAVATVWLIEFQSVSLYFRAMIKGTQILSSRSLKWGGGTGTPSKWHVFNLLGTSLAVVPLARGKEGKGWGGARATCELSLWVPCSEMPLAGWIRHGEPVTWHWEDHFLPCVYFPHNSSVLRGDEVLVCFMVRTSPGCSRLHLLSMGTLNELLGLIYCLGSCMCS